MSLYCESSKVHSLPYCLLVYIMLWIFEFMNGLIDKLLELCLPAIIKLIQTWVSLNAVLVYSADEIFTSLSILFCLLSSTLSCISTIFLGFFWLSLIARIRAKDCRCAEYFVEMLKLLPRTLLVSICYSLIIYLNNVREAIHYKGTQEDSVWNLITFYWNWNDCV